MKIQDHIVIVFTQVMAKPEELSCFLFFRDSVDFIQVRVSPDEVLVGFFYDIRNRCFGEGLSENPKGRRGHHDVPDSSQPDEENLFYGGGINLWFPFLVQCWPLR